MRRTVLASLFAAAAALGAGCSPAIGDACETSVDCSVQGDRICDTASPGGYCTVPSCEEGTCPEETLCVEFRYDPARLAVSYCMAPCDETSDCRDDEGYRCVRASSPSVLGPDGESIARLLDGSDSKKFCAAID
jgi:hypothetical protein